MKPDVKKFLSSIDAGTSGAGNLSIDQYRNAVNQVSVMDLPACELEYVRDHTVDGIDIRVYDRRPTRSPSPILLYFHGGCWVAGGTASHGSICSSLAEYLDIPVILVQYRLAPEHKWPTQLNDCETIARWVSTCPSLLERIPTGLILCGDSGGATLTISTAQLLRDNPADVPVLLQVPICPLVDPEGSYKSRETYKEGYFYTEDASNYWRAYHQGFPNDPKVSPLLGEHNNMPTTLLISAELDVSRDSVREYGKRLIEHGTKVIYYECEGMIHGFPVFRRMLPSAQKYMEDVMKLIKAMI